MTAESLPRMVRRASEVRAIRHQLQREFYARWEESKHPRDEDGKFSEKDGGKRSRKAPRKTLKHFPALSMRLDDYIEKNHPNAISLALYKEGGSEWFQEHYPDVDLLEDIFRPEREVKEEWQFQARAAFSVGAITADDLNTLVETYPGEKGVSWKWSGVGRAQPDGPDKNTGDLPETLYHATTAATPVEEVGLKSREELNQSFGAGLGGGDDDTISFTTDRELAEVIASTIKLGRRVARGEVTVDDLMRDAREGVGTNGKPYDSDQLKKQVEDIHRPQRKFGWKPTVATDSDGNPTSYEASFGPWEPDPKHEPNEKGNHVHWVRYPNEEQVLDRTMSAFKYWLAYREAAGGPPDPLFFLSDAAGLANLDEDEIKVVEAKPVEGAKGYQVSAMSEWRTWSGDSVDIVDIYRRQLQAATDRGELDREFYRRGFYNKQFDESKVKRDADGKFATKAGSGKTDDEVYTDYLLGLTDDEEIRRRAWERHQEEMREVKEQMAAEAKAKADAEKAKAEAEKKFWSVTRGSNATVNAVRNLEKTQKLLMDDLIDITNKELDKKGRVTSIRIGSSESQMVDERTTELQRALWGTTAGHDSLMGRIPNLSDTARVYAKKAVNARLTDRMMPAAIKAYSSADDFMESSGRRRFFDNEEDIREHVKRVVRDWVDQWAATSGKGPEAIALQLAALEEFDLGEDERFSIVDVPEWSWDESRERSPHIRDWTDDELHDNFDMYETISKVYRAVVRSRRSLMGYGDAETPQSPTNDPTRSGFVATANNLMDSIADGNGEWLEPPHSPAGFRVPQKIPTTKFEFDEVIEFLVEVRQSISDSSRGGVDDAGRPVPAPDKWHDASTMRRTDLLRSEIEHIDSPEREEFLDNPPGHTAKGVDHLSGARFKHYAYTMHTMLQPQIEALMDLRDLGNRPPKTEMDKETREDPDRMPTEREAWHALMQRLETRASQAGFDERDIWRKGNRNSNYPAAAEKIFNTVAWASQDKETRWSKEQARIRAKAANAKNRDIKEAQKIASDKQVGPMMRAFVRAQYDETQEKLAEAGYEPDDTIALYRGMNFSDEQMPEALKGGSPEFTESETVQSAMSSYSMNFNEAASFAGKGNKNSAMAAAHVPVGSILSLPTTGVGCLTEGEVVVLRNDGKKYISVSDKYDDALFTMSENYLDHLRQNWEGPTGQRLDNGHGDDLVPLKSESGWNFYRQGDIPAWYSRSG